MGYLVPDHSHVWLCPTHHAAVHALRNYVTSGFNPALGTPTVHEVIFELNFHNECQAVLDIAGSTGNGMTEKAEAEWNIEQLRKSARARVLHANALQAWNENRSFGKST